MSTANSDLDMRISVALQEHASSGEIAALLVDVETAASEAGNEAERERSRSLDPVLSPRDVAAARNASEDAAFRRDRLQEAMRRLNICLNQAKRREEQARRQRNYDRVKSERDKLAAELLQLYPEAASRLADLVSRIVANDRAVNSVNVEGLPEGAHRLLSAELVARGLGGFTRDGVDTPRITENLRLPEFHRNPHRPYSWPLTWNAGSTLAN